MDKQTSVNDDVIELGVASVETKGRGEVILDSLSSKQGFASLSDD